MEKINIYQEPDIYGAILQQPIEEIIREAAFIDSLLKTHREGNAEDILEICCGTCPHSLELASKGYKVVGLDHSEIMLHYAHEKASQRNLSVRSVCADMKKFALDTTFDAAICCYESILHLLTNEDWYVHLQTVAQHLKPSGIYYIVLDTPNQWVNQLIAPDAEQIEYYTGDKKIGDSTYHIKMFSGPLNFHTGVYKWGISSTVTQGNHVTATLDSFNKLRFLTTQELCAIIDASGVFDVINFYGDFHQEAQLQADSPKRIVVLRKKAHISDDDKIAWMKHVYQNILLDEVWSQRKSEKIDDIFTEDFFEHGAIPQYAGNLEEHKQMALDWQTAFPDMKLIAKDMVVEGDKLAGSYYGCGTHLGEFMGYAPTGIRVMINAIDIMHFKDGKIAEWWHQEDVHELLQKIKNAS